MKHRVLSTLVIVFLTFASGFHPDGIRAQDSGQLRRITGPCDFDFPQDHGPHNDFRTEWWYYTGNVTDRQGRPFGFQLTFFRSKITASDKEQPPVEKKSPWRTEQILLAHAALSDISGENHLQEEKMARKTLNIADALEKDGITRVHIADWRLVLAPQNHLLKARANDFGFALSLIPQKPPVPHGNKGYSRKGKKIESASCYYSFTRLEVEGVINYRGQSFSVEGLGWMDHEFSSAPLEDDLTGWDWFSLQLDNETELMLYLLRHDDGTFSSASSGTIVNPSGKGRHLSPDEFSIEVLDYWNSGRSQARYPSRWRISVPVLDTVLEVAPNFENQEMVSPDSTRVTYWEGSVSATGTFSGKKIEGMGYVELTGYAEKFNAPM